MNSVQQEYLAIFEVQSFPPVQYLAIFRCVGAGLSASCLRERRPLLVCIFILSSSWPRLARSSLDEAIKEGSAGKGAM